MTDVNSGTCTAVTVYFEGNEHQNAANDFVIQFADGGLDQHIEGMFENIDRNVEDTDFDTSKRTITIKMGK